MGSRLVRAALILVALLGFTLWSIRTDKTTACGGDWKPPGTTCTFVLDGNSLELNGEGSGSTAVGEITVEVKVVSASGYTWNCSATAGGSPRFPRETAVDCGEIYSVPAALVGSEATCRVSGTQGGTFRCVVKPESVPRPGPSARETA